MANGLPQMPQYRELMGFIPALLGDLFLVSGEATLSCLVKKRFKLDIVAFVWMAM